MLQELRKKCIEESKSAVRDSVNEDNFMVQAIVNIDELDRTCNNLTSRIKEWYSLYFPELSRNVKDNEAFIKLVLKSDKKELMKEIKLKESMGASLDEADLIPVLQYAESVRQLQVLRDSFEEYLGGVMENYCKNLQAVAGTTIGAKLMSEVGSLKRLAMMPSTAIQMLGAEKALFRHLKTGAKPPRHGHIVNHPLIQKTPEKQRGKVARALADKIALAVRADFFGKSFIGKDLRKELEAKFK